MVSPVLENRLRSMNNYLTICLLNYGYVWSYQHNELMRESWMPTLHYQLLTLYDITNLWTLGPD